MIDVVGFLSTIGERFIDHPWVYLTMPFVAAAIGYGTKLAAIRMMFEPLEFVGVGRFGWQGIIPRRAAKMAAIAVETMTANLLDTRDIISRLDPERMAAEIEGPLLEAIEEITQEVCVSTSPACGSSCPTPPGDWSWVACDTRPRGSSPGCSTRPRTTSTTSSTSSTWSCPTSCATSRC